MPLAENVYCLMYYKQCNCLVLVAVTGSLKIDRTPSNMCVNVGHYMTEEARIGFIYASS